MGSARRQTSQSAVRRPYSELIALKLTLPRLPILYTEAPPPELSAGLDTQRETEHLLCPSRTFSNHTETQKRLPFSLALPSSQKPQGSPGELPTPILKNMSSWLLIHSLIPDPSEVQRMNLLHSQIGKQVARKTGPSRRTPAEGSKRGHSLSSAACPATRLRTNVSQASFQKAGPKECE